MKISVAHVMFLLALCAAHLSYAQGVYSMRRSVVPSVGGVSASTSYTLRFTLAEPVAGKIASTSNVCDAGFWGGTGVRPCPADITFDGTVDFNDLLEFLNWLSTSDPRADLTRDGVIDFNDLLEFLNLFGQPC